MVTRIGLINAPDGTLGSSDKYDIATMISFAGTTVSTRTTGPINFYSRTSQYDTVLFMKFEGNDGEFFTTDSSPSNHVTFGNTVILSSGTAYIDAVTTPAVGSSSAYFADDFPVDNSCWVISGHTDWNFFQKDFRIQFYIKWETNNDGITGFQEFNSLLLWPGINSMSLVYKWGLTPGDTPGNINRFSYEVNRTFGADFVAQSSVFVPVLGTWYNIRFEKEAPNHAWYINSVQSGITTVSTEDGLDVSGGVVGLVIGSPGSSSPRLAFNGWLDQLTISKNNNPPVAGQPVQFYSRTNGTDINFYGQ